MATRAGEATKGAHGDNVSGGYLNLRRRAAASRTTRSVELFDQGPFSDDAMDIPGWCEFQAARRRFLDRLAADAADRRRAGQIDLPETTTAAPSGPPRVQEEERECL